MCLKKLFHHSITNPSSIYDEEALSALELAGRTAAKVNEVIDKVTEFETKTIPETVDKEVDEMIESGVFDEKLNEYVAGGAFAVQNKNLYDYMSQLTADSFKLKPTIFERGSWNNNDVPNNNVTYRARTVEAIHFPFDTVITIATGFRIGGYVCDDFGNSETPIAWSVDPYKLPAKTKVKLIIARVNEDTTETANVNAFADQITVVSSIEAKFLELDEMIQSSGAASFNLNAAHFKNGSLEGWVAGDFSPSYKYRIATPSIISLPFKAVFRAASGFKFALCVFDGTTFERDTGWITTEYTLDAGKSFRLMIGRSSEITSEIADIPTFAAACAITNYSVMALDEGNAANVVDFDFTFGYIDKGIVKGSNCRLVTRNILKLKHGITLKHNGRIAIAVCTYTDAIGNGYSDKGWVTLSNDYTIPAGTYFRLMVRAYDYADEKPIECVNVVDSELYKAIAIVHAGNDNTDVFTPLEHAKRVVNKAIKSIQRKPATPHEVKGINHRGYNSIAPENTLPAYIESKKHGFKFVECDVRFTSDGVPVLLHDETINRTGRESDGSELTRTIKINELTLDVAKMYDFGSYLSEEHKGTKITTFSEFMNLCRRLSLHPYIELEGSITAAQASTLLKIVELYGMSDSVTWISFTVENLQKIIDLDPSARVGYNMNTSNGITDAQLTRLFMLRTGYNEVFANVDNPEPCVNTAIAHDFGLECWTFNDKEEITTLPNYVSGVTSDLFNTPDVLLESYDLNNDNSSGDTGGDEGDDNGSGGGSMPADLTFTVNGEVETWTSGTTWKSHPNYSGKSSAIHPFNDPVNSYVTLDGGASFLYYGDTPVKETDVIINNGVYVSKIPFTCDGKSFTADVSNGDKTWQRVVDLQITIDGSDIPYFTDSGDGCVYGNEMTGKVINSNNAYVKLSDIVVASGVYTTTADT